jgi:hypothetical protein
LFGAVGSSVVLATIVVVVSGLLAIYVLIEVDLLSLVFGVWIFNSTSLSHTNSSVALVLAVIDIFSSVTVADHVCTCYLVTLLLSFDVVSKEGVHVEDVVSVSRFAAPSIGRSASVGRTKTESHKTLGLDTDIIGGIGLSVPLGDVVASLELDGVVNSPGDVNLILILVKKTSVLHDLHAKFRVEFDVVSDRDHVVTSEDRKWGGADGGHQGEKGKDKLHFD